MAKKKSFDKFCADDYQGARRTDCAIARRNGEVEGRQSATSHIYYLDASELISENAYGTGGGTHSDIYRFEHGRLVYAAVMGDGFWSNATSGK